MGLSQPGVHPGSSFVTTVKCDRPLRVAAAGVYVIMGSFDCTRKMTAQFLRCCTRLVWLFFAFASTAAAGTMTPAEALERYETLVKRSKSIEPTTDRAQVLFVLGDPEQKHVGGWGTPDREYWVWMPIMLALPALAMARLLWQSRQSPAGQRLELAAAISGPTVIRIAAAWRHHFGVVGRTQADASARVT